MSLLQMRINEELPYGRVFQGDGTPDPKDAGVKFYQHGLYFLANGELAVKSPHNASKIELIESLGGNPEEPALDTQEPHRQPVNPEIVAKLADKTDAEVQVIAMRMVAALQEQGETVDYVPVESERDDNVCFIAKYAS